MEVTQLARCGREELRPAQPECPRCSCCTAALCARGRIEVGECAGRTPQEYQRTVAGCPCSSRLTVGTVAWRAGMVRATRHAVEQPLPWATETVLRGLAERVPSVADPGGAISSLYACGYITANAGQLVATALGRAYLAGRDGRRSATPVLVDQVDVAERTARVVVAGWSLTEPVTVLLEQVMSATSLEPGELPGMLLDGVANLDAATADEVVLTGIRTPLRLLSAGWQPAAVGGGPGGGVAWTP